jgi:hypothetical protein|tara:strand:- start:31 stop:249 length:219 start_codon:yes stop_codon:yes gene_type:complete
MKIGELYRFDRINGHTHHLNDRLALYLGEDFIHRDDGVIVENHKVLVVGAPSPTIIDRGLLTYMREVLSENR